MLFSVFAAEDVFNVEQCSSEQEAGMQRRIHWQPFARLRVRQAVSNNNSHVKRESLRQIFYSIDSKLSALVFHCFSLYLTNSFLKWLFSWKSTIKGLNIKNSGRTRSENHTNWCIQILSCPILIYSKIVLSFKLCICMAYCSTL